MTIKPSHKVEYETLLVNLNMMINLLEFDAMRSAGKMKLNSQHLESMYNLKDRYDAFVAKSVKKEK